MCFMNSAPRTPHTQSSPKYTAFHGGNRIASGDLDHVALKTKHLIDAGQSSLIVIFDNASGRIVDLDFRGTTDDVLKRMAAMTGDAASDGRGDAPRGPGRPRLGVIAREVTLLPRHWDWLNTQPGGASVALRKLVEEARRTHAGHDRTRQAQEAAYRFMSAMAGDRPGFEEAARALFAGKRERFDEQIAQWPVDVTEHLRLISEGAFHEENE